jgi:N-acetylgalactosamine-N,N'-diacetylbacillosaminyl-diphospho-undecaprenol 4-alpha-N-acetylgalactosaminyltransferase
MPSLSGGGAERVATLLVPVLGRHFEVELALLEDRRSYALPDGISVTAFSPPLAGPAAHIARIPRHVWRLARLVRKSRARVVLSFMEQANVINCLASYPTGHRAVISQRVEPRRQFAGKGVLGRSIRSASGWLYPRASQVVAVSGGVRQVLLDDYHLVPERVTTIPNPVDTAMLALQAGAEPALELPPRYLLHVGRLRLAQKGQDTLLSAFRSLRERFADLGLVLVGQGRDRARIEDRIRELRLSDAVVLAGWQENVAALMARAEVFVFPSRYEGWPNALVEAMACGCPVVAADCPTGPREIVGESEHGVLVPPEDPDALARALERLLSDASLRERYAEAALRRVREFAVEEIGARYLRVLEAVAANGG